MDYLLQDKKTGRLSFRRIYPVELRPFVPGSRVELKRSLGTGSIDAPGAIEKYRKAAAEYEATVTNASKAAAGSFDRLDAPRIAYLAEAFRVETLERDEAARWADGDEKEARYAAKKRETLDGMVPLYRSLHAEGDLDGLRELWGDEAEAFAIARGLRVDSSHPSFRQLCRAMNEAAIKAAVDKLARLDGHPVPTPPEPDVPSSNANPNRAKASFPGLSLVEIGRSVMDKPRLGLSATTKEAYGTALRFWKEVLGNITPQEITRAHVSRWLDLLAQRPARLPTVERDIGLVQLVARYEGRERVKRLSGKTMEQHLGSLAALWSKCQREGEIAESLANPFRGHAVTASPRRRREMGFSTSELQAIFDLPVFTKGERPGRGKGEAVYWIPLLLLWTGARPDEIAQLMVSDIFKDEGSGRWILKITDEGDHPYKGPRRLKTSEHETGEREFPIPQPLLDLGFLSYVSSIKAAGETALFPKLRTKGRRNLLFAGFSEWWSAYLYGQGVLIKGEGRQPAREFRHTWTTAARACGLRRESTEYIQGHSTAGGSAHEDYGSKTPLGREIDLLKFPGLDLSNVKPWAA